MQIKTIQKSIQNKLNEWLSSISDENLRILIKENILVSGGSITSMLLNEDVNDFDIYIKDIKALEKLTEYYVDKFDIKILRGWEKENLMESYNTGILAYDENYKNQFTVAVNNLKDDQIKLFILNIGGLKCNSEATTEEKLKYIPLYFSPNAISLSNKIQIVLRFHGDSTQIHKTFDFIHATNYFTFQEGLITNKEAQKKQFN